jgi:hypothetical protein
MLQSMTQELCPPEINNLASLDEAGEFSQFGIDAIGIQRQARSRFGRPPKVSRKIRNSARQWETLKEEIRQVYIRQYKALAMTMERLKQILDSKQAKPRKLLQQYCALLMGDANQEQGPREIGPAAQLRILVAKA